MKSPAVSLVTFGCAKNLVDSEVMLGLLHRAGYRFVRDGSEADIIILNTCGFIGPSRDEAEDAIREALEEKRRRGTRVIVTGCHSERATMEGQTAPAGVDAWIGVRDYDRIVAVVRGEHFPKGKKTFLYDDTSPRIPSTPRGWAYLKISEGCSHECAFCAIPLIKGPYCSRPRASILREAGNLARRGIRELVIISQDTTYYGRERGLGDGLARLLEDLTRVPDLAWIRFLYGYPEEITTRLLEAMAHPKICRYLDIPFQHADPIIVKRMKRTMPAGRALRLLERVRRLLPGVSIRTSLIVGFPGEGPSEFGSLLEFVREARFDHLGVFAYSSEKGTPAAILGDPLPLSLKEERRNRVLELQASISAENLKAQKGRILDVVIDGPWERSRGLLAGRTRFQAPEVDGLVLIDRPPDWKPDGPPIRQVEITHTDVYDLHGRLAE